MKKIAFLFFIGLLLASCSTAGWIDNPYSVYSQEDYLCGFGSGDSYDQACVNAKEEIASQFGSFVSKQARATAFNSRDEFSNSFELQQTVSVKVDNLMGMEIVRQKKEHGLYTVLAVMPKNKTAEYYLCEMESLDLQCKNLQDKTEKEMGTFKAVSDAVSLLDLCSEYNEKALIYSFLSGENLVFLNKSEFTDLYERALSSVIAEVKVTGDKDSLIATSLEKILTDAGFRIAGPDLEPSVFVFADVTWSESKGVGAAEGFVFACYDAHIDILNPDDGSKLFVRTFRGKEGSLSVSDAELRAVRKIVSELETLSDFIEDKFVREYR